MTIRSEPHGEEREERLTGSEDGAGGGHGGVAGKAAQRRARRNHPLREARMTGLQG